MISNLYVYVLLNFGILMVFINFLYFLFFILCIKNPIFTFFSSYWKWSLLVTSLLHLERINAYLFFLVLYSYFCNWSRIQTNNLKPKILFPWRVEYIWFHHSSSISTRIRIRRCSRSFCSQVFSFGKY